MGTTQLERGSARGTSEPESLVAQARRMAGREAETPPPQIPREPVTAWDGRVRRSPVQTLRGPEKPRVLPWVAGAALTAAVIGLLLFLLW